MLVLNKKERGELSKKTIAIVGLGALGSFTAGLLAKYGSNLIIIDRDIVEERNLGRQILYDRKDVGKLKALVAKEKLSKINKKIKEYAVDLDYENVDLLKADLVLDCTDNFETRFLINDYCNKNKIKWIYSSAIRKKGFVFVIDDVCFSCLFKPVEGLETCNEVGISNEVIKKISEIQVNEALNILLGREYDKTLIYVDLDKNEIKKLKVKKNIGCKACKGIYDYLDKPKVKIIKFCGSGNYQIKGNYDFEELKRRFNKKGDYFKLDNITVFKNRVLVKAENEKEAKKIYSKVLGD